MEFKAHLLHRKPCLKEKQKENRKRRKKGRVRTGRKEGVEAGRGNMKKTKEEEGRRRKTE